MKHTFSKLQLLNITTGFLYTTMDDIYNFFDTVIHPGFMTHQLPTAREAILPILKQKLDLPFENHTFDANMVDYSISFEFTEEDKNQFQANYLKMPDLLQGKNVIVVTI